MVFTIRRKLITLAVTAVLFICIACMGAGSVHAAEKNGLVTKASGSIYYYQKGKLLKNAWKTVTIKKKKYKYYFGKNGAAYKAPANLFGFYNVKVFKIGKAKYGSIRKAILWQRESMLMTAQKYGCLLLPANIMIKRQRH